MTFFRNCETLIHLIKGNIGTGILAMPDGLKNSGLFTGTALLPFIAVICIHCMHMLVSYWIHPSETYLECKLHNTDIYIVKHFSIECFCIMFQELCKKPRSIKYLNHKNFSQLYGITVPTQMKTSSRNTWTDESRQYCQSQSQFSIMMPLNQSQLASCYLSASHSACLSPHPQSVLHLLRLCCALLLFLIYCILLDIILVYHRQEDPVLSDSIINQELFHVETESDGKFSEIDGDIIDEEVFMKTWVWIWW